MKQKRQKRADLDVKYILKTYWSFLRKEKPLLTGLIISALFITIIGLYTRILYKTVIEKGEIFARGEMSASTFVESFIIIAIIWIIALILVAIIDWIKIHTLNKLETNMMFDLKTYFYNHILNLSHKFHTTHKTGSMIARIGRGSSAMERMTDFMAFQILTLIFEVIISGIALVYIDKTIGLVALISGIMFAFYHNTLQKIQRKRTLVTNSAEDIEKAMIGDTFTNIDSIKHYGKENIIQNKYSFLSNKTKNAQLSQWQIERPMNLGRLIMNIGSLLILFIAIKSFINGNITLGALVFAWGTYWGLMESIRNFMQGLRGYHRSIADFHDLFQYGKIENDIKDVPNAKNMQIKHGIIEFNNVSFKYNQNELFKNFNLKVNQNQKVALVGHSGSGKSTLVKLIYRLYDLDKGEIIIDGKNIKDIKQKSLRSELSIVPQECVLFDDTIYKNISFSNPKATRREVLQAIKFAQLDKTIAKFPYKENTIVGERGVKLSGGEKQRVSIARAILANKKILLLDEATSSLDSKTESEIQRDLQKLMQGRTSIIIAHRLSTIMSADLIIVLDKGKIAQQGTHNQLINKPGIYRELWSLQKGGYLGE